VLQLIDVTATSLVSDKHVAAGQFQLVFPGAGALAVKVNDAYYCDVLLLKQLLPDVCQAAGDQHTTSRVR